MKKNVEKGIQGVFLKSHLLQHLMEVVNLLSNQQIQLNCTICRTLHLDALKSDIKNTESD